MLKALSPIHKLDRIKTPLIVLHGANDTNVPVIEAEQIVQQLRARNVPVEYVLFPDEGHGFARPENNLKFVAAAEEFLARYLGGRAEPPSEKDAVDELRQ